jgi:hypothetical protein
VVNVKFNNTFFHPVEIQQKTGKQNPVPRVIKGIKEKKEIGIYPVFEKKKKFSVYYP